MLLKPRARSRLTMAEPTMPRWLATKMLESSAESGMFSSRTAGPRGARVISGARVAWRSQVRRDHLGAHLAGR